jgi:uncharacterized glyoxalase superfamily protein PhnB
VSPVGSDTSITLVTWFPSMPAGSLKGLVLETLDMEATIAEIAARGFVIEGAIDEQPWGQFVTFDDPDGNGIVLRAPVNGVAQRDSASGRLSQLQGVSHAS